MHSKKIVLTNFSRAIASESLCFRPDNEPELQNYLAHHKPEKLLARGAGLSYSDTCLNQNGMIIDMKRFNHLLRFDSESGIAECQGGVTFQDLLLLHPAFVPPVIPGTIHATIAGGIAHDVHGKNNPLAGSFGQHIVWLDLLIGDRTLHCNREKNRELFYATIGGLGLTGIITRVGLRLKKVSRFVCVEHKQFDSLKTLIEYMSSYGLNHDYQVAWIDLLNAIPRALLSGANHCESSLNKREHIHKIPKLPFGLIKSWNMKLFNKLFFNSKKPKENLSLEQFNNPLDKIILWNRLYGSKGFIQFQAVFDQESALNTMEHLVQLIKNHKATPTLAVLKLFTQSGEGLLSFCKPGFTLAIDFIHNTKAREVIKAMNQYITEINGRVYLAKDLLLTEKQYQKMYTKHQEFAQVLKKNQCSMRSDLSLRLGIIQ